MAPLVALSLQFFLILISNTCGRSAEETRGTERIAKSFESVEIPLNVHDGKSITEFFPVGYVKDGSRDYTKYIQLAIDKYDNLVFPGYPLSINDQGLSVGSNKTI